MSTAKWVLTILLAFNISTDSFSQIFQTEDEHKRILDSLRIVLTTKQQDSARVNTLNAISLELFQWSEEGRPEALNYAIEAKELSQKINYKKGLSEAFIKIGIDFLLKEKFDESIRYYSQALDIRKEINDRDGIIECYWAIGSAYGIKQDYEKAASYNNIALLLAEKSGDKKLIVSAYEILGRYYFGQEPPRHPEALKYYLMGYKVAIENNQTDFIYGIGNNLGLTYLRLGDFKEALRIFKHTKSLTGTNIPNGNMTWAYLSLDMFDEALLLYRVLLEKNIKASNSRMIGFCLSQLGYVYFEKSNSAFKKHEVHDSTLVWLDSTLFYFDSSKTLTISKNLPSNLPITEMNYGKIHKMKGAILTIQKTNKEQIKNELGLAHLHFQKGLLVAEKAKNDPSLPEYYLKTGETIFAMAEFETPGKAKQIYEQALRLFEKALFSAKSLSNKQAIRDAYKDIAMAYHKLNTFDKSFEYFSLYDNMKDSVTSIESDKKLGEIRLMGETIVGATEERARHDKVMTMLNFEHAKKEDSLSYMQGITDEQLKRQMLLGKQQEKDLLLKQVSLDLANNEIELGELNFLRSQAELRAEQSQRQEKEKQLTISEQEKKLQASHLKLQDSELALKENQLAAASRQRFFYIGSLVLMAFLFFFIYRNIRIRQKSKIAIANEKLKSEKANAAHRMAELELQSLRAQLNPHFMFNSLNAIQELILREDTVTSHLYLSYFSDLLRMLLDNAAQPFIPLRKEVALLELYLSLEKLRIPDLEFYFDIDPEANVDESMIPNMILQPYIENSIWHGLSPKKGGKKLYLRIRKNGECMHFQIEDNGIGREKAKELKSLYRKEHKSKGMELLSKRFTLMSREFDTIVRTDVTDLLSKDGLSSGTLVEILIPYNIKEKLNFFANDQSYNY